MATPTQAHALLTLAEVEALPEGNFEVDGGELLQMSSSKLQNKLIAMLCQQMLLEATAVNPGWLVFPEMAFVIAEEPVVLRIPDVAVVREDRVKGTPGDKYVQGAPELAVEVVSPSDSAEGLERKSRQYFEAGAQLVWQIYPETRTVHVYRADGSAAVLDQQGALTAPELFGDWSAPVSTLFER